MAGGTTTIVDCIAPGKDESLIEAYNKWRGWADEKACCDYAFRVALPAVTEQKLQEVQELTSEDIGVNTVFMTMEGVNKLSDDELLRVFEFCAKTGKSERHLCDLTF